MKNTKIPLFYSYKCLFCSFSGLLSSKNGLCPICNTIYHGLPPFESIITNTIQPKSLIITGSTDPLTIDSYNNGVLLHIGVSDSEGIIYHFWKEYKKEKASESPLWSNIINIPLYPLEIDDFTFNQVLKEDHCFQSKVYPYYNQFSNNCYSFITRFLNKIHYKGLNTWTKESIAEAIIAPVLESLSKYKTNDKSFVCDVCSKVLGKEIGHFRCISCPDYDLCNKCNKESPHKHEMKDLGGI